MLKDMKIKVSDYGVSSCDKKGRFATICGTPIFSAP